MDFSWSDETLDLRADLLRFAAQELDHDVDANDPTLGFSRANWDRCADYGVLGWMLPKKYGGSELDIMTAVYLLETLGYACTDTGLTFALSSQMLSIQPVIEKFGSDELKSATLPRLVAGACGAFAISEEDSGSDTYAMQATATPKEDGYVINGKKRFITLAPVADIAVIFANANPARGQWGVSAFVVERGQPGFTTSPTQPKMGLRTTPIGDIDLTDCFVTNECRLGAEGAGVSIFATAMQSERSYILATQLGAMERQLENTIKYVRERRQFGKPVGKFQGVSDRIVDMKLRLETSRLLLYRVAWLETQGKPLLMEAALTNLQLSEAFVASSLDALRNFGARGYLSEYGIERDMRDSLGGLIYSGTSDIQRSIVARVLGL